MVDQYGSFGGVSNRPWSAHALFGLDGYRPFGDLFPRSGDSFGELILLNTTHELPIHLQPIELFTMQKLYEGFLSGESLARELFVSKGTINSWNLKKEIAPTVSLPMGRSTIRLFDPDQVDVIRTQKSLRIHTEETLLEDFWAFIEERTYSFSYKMIFIFPLLETIDSTGDADIKMLVERYRSFYLERIHLGKVVDRANSPYLAEYFLRDDRALTQNLLSNPFDKFERKRFMYYTKDLKKISIHHRIWDDLTRNNGIHRLKT